MLRIARRHGLLPLMHRQAASLPPGTVPPVSLVRMEEEARRNLRRNLLLTADLLKVLELFKAAGIHAVPLKGPILAASLYGDLALREFCDLDILVSPRDVSKAQGILLSDGYRPLAQIPGGREAGSRWGQNHHQLVNPGGTVVEIHWDLLPGSFHVAFDREGLWARTQRLALGGAEVRSLSAEDQLLFLCVHGAKHLWERLIWVCDVAQILRRIPRIDGDRLFRSAGRAGAGRMLLLGLFLAGDLIGVDLPPEISRRAASDRRVRRLAADMKARFFKGAASPFGFFELLPFYLRMRERLQDKVRDAVFHALTLRVSNPLRLAAKCGGRLLERISWAKRGAEAGI